MPIPAAVLGSLVVAAFAITQDISGCKSLNDIGILQCQQEQCYCYDMKRSRQPMHIWSSVQVRINSTGTFRVVRISNGTNCQYPETFGVFIRCLIQDIRQERELNETHIYINQADEKVCFTIQTNNDVRLHTESKRNLFHINNFLASCVGIFLFYYADTLSRSTMVYYSAGITVGILATLVLLMFLLKRFISKHNIFWVLMSGSWISSIFFIHFVKENINWLWHENKKWLFGYFLVVGCVSFAICYRNGPLTNERSIHLLTWTLQLIGCLLIYFSVSMPEAAYALIAILVFSRVLHYPARGFCYLGRKLKNCLVSGKRGTKLLTEEEYREQVETETTKALEELRLSCANLDFPTWHTVARLRNPHKFAEFVLGSHHLSEKEMNDYDEQYGPGGLFLEEQLFSRREPEQDQRVDSVQDQQEPEERAQNDMSQGNDIELFSATNIVPC
ncbi:LOW QUALITY PROTEIN: nuclear envelope integral membrane protein 2 [Microcaecilia unicolor]|uniref:LOW QUALITY PROTEIN: nuclear envelope integral membrane protein 2 n=1 Tax=Microcaecilia unicolor TaxID=1415580 RepID=A0A6P7YP96_9AMPH|nr:LOW QUALITY PROTEIN: nuclear envelope integral membrane protein 2 [Microcaecilia unicolor]